MEGKQACATSACGAGISSSTEGYAWDVGVSYAFGPWAFGVTYIQGNSEGLLADPDHDEMQAVSGGLSYALGPGITARGGVMWTEWAPEDRDSQSGIVGAFGLSFSF
jgi:predicted porin